MNKSIEIGLEVAAQMQPEAVIASLKSTVGSDAFGAALGEFTLGHVFGSIWSRPGMGRRERSLVTLGILVALRQVDELKIHAVIALRNGVTVQELEELIYQASAYAGFPAAASAFKAISGALQKEGHLPPSGSTGFKTLDE